VTEISYLVVNTNHRERLLACLESVFATMPDLPCDVWVLDNASQDGSAEAVRSAYGERVNLLALGRRAGKAENDTRLLEASSGHYCMLLNEDTELLPGAAQELHRVLELDPKAAVAGAQLLSPDGEPQPCAWRFPSPGTALVGALFLHRRYTVQSVGDDVRKVDWVQSSAMLVRRSAYERVGGLDPQFFVYSDEVDWCKRFHDGGWSVLYVPGARAIHHEQLSSDAEQSERRIVEFARNRDRYMRKHHSPAAAATVRVLSAWTYGVRAAAAAVMEEQDPARYARHAYYSLAPSRGEGLAEAAARFNAGLPPGKADGEDS
jgi:N-acetylglucosaminyl-diphospho-decaprenol L-rhamnosyltransferase